MLGLGDFFYMAWVSAIFLKFVSSGSATWQILSTEVQDNLISSSSYSCSLSAITNLLKDYCAVTNVYNRYLCPKEAKNDSSEKHNPICFRPEFHLAFCSHMFNEVNLICKTFGTVQRFFGHHGIKSKLLKRSLYWKLSCIAFLFLDHHASEFLERHIVHGVVQKTLWEGPSRTLIKHQRSQDASGCAGEHKCDILITLGQFSSLMIRQTYCPKNIVGR